MCLSVCVFLHLCIASIQCQNLNPLSPVLAHHPFTSTPPALRCPTPRLRLLAMASAPPQVRRLRLPLSSSASCPLPVLATHPERYPHASASRSTSSYWREASRSLLELLVFPPSPPPPLILLPQLPTAPPRTLPQQLLVNCTQVCFTRPRIRRNKPAHGGYFNLIMSGRYFIEIWLWIRFVNIW